MAYGALNAACAKGLAVAKRPKAEKDAHLCRTLKNLYTLGRLSQTVSLNHVMSFPDTKKGSETGGDTSRKLRPFQRISKPKAVFQCMVLSCNVPVGKKQKNRGRCLKGLCAMLSSATNHKHSTHLVYAHFRMLQVAAYRSERYSLESE